MINIGIIGSTGLVGKAILESFNMFNLFSDTNNNKYNISLFGTYDSSFEMKINNIDTTLQIHRFEFNHLHNLKYIILAVENDTSKQIYSYCTENNLNITIIDNSSEFRLQNDIVLCIPEINSEKLNKLILEQNKPLMIANPNCVTTLMCMVLKPLLSLGSIKKIIASTYQAASGAGYKGLHELETQTEEIILNDSDDSDNRKNLTTDFWKRQYVYNVFSHNSKINKQNLFNEEELKLVYETKKILNINPKITATCIRVPTLRSHCISLNIEFDKIIKKEDILIKLNGFPGISILDNTLENQFPEPVLTSQKTDVFVGRIRSDIDDETCWNFFISGDQLLKGAGYNSVQILHYLLNL